ncbi:hypothetical protein ACHQM5_013153 [Ranunculus cassubicifolius]
MEKLTDEMMDLTEWDLLSDDEDVVTRGGMLVSAKLDFVPKGGFVMNYFPRSPTKSNHMPKQFRVSDEEVVKEVIKIPIVEINKQDHLISSSQQQLSFEKSNKFVDIKMDSPKSSKGNKNQESVSVPFLDLKDTENNKDFESISKDESGKKNIWSWKLTGIGALCSIGMAAATICIFVISSQQRHKHQQNQKLRFQIYTDDKRFKQVVHHATKLNQAISSVRGGAFNSAHITFGGYYVYDGL